MQESGTEGYRGLSYIVEVGEIREHPYYSCVPSPSYATATIDYYYYIITIRMYKENTESPILSKALVLCTMES